ncbi:hypothetical protein Tco_1218707 [Tanacetum coccineum]
MTVMREKGNMYSDHSVNETFIPYLLMSRVSTSNQKTQSTVLNLNKQLTLVVHKHVKLIGNQFGQHVDSISLIHFIHKIELGISKNGKGIGAGYSIIDGMEAVFMKIHWVVWCMLMLGKTTPCLDITSRRFNTGRQHVNSGNVYVNSGTQIKSGSSRFNTGKLNVNSGSVHVNSARVTRPVSNQTSYKSSPKFSQVTRINWRILKNSIGDLLPLEVA